MSPRSPVALLLSCVAHLAVGAALVMASSVASEVAPDATGSSAPPADERWLGTRQLVKGAQRQRPPGRDAMYEVLSAGDGVAVRLTSPTGGPAVGLAWLSPSTGLWLAVDLAQRHRGESLQVWQTFSDGTRLPLVTMDLDADGSGRVLATWNAGSRPEPAASVTLELTAPKGYWPFRTPDRVLHGTTPTTSRTDRSGG